MTDEERKELNMRRTQKARETRAAKYTKEQLKEFSSKGGKKSTGSWQKGDERAVEAAKKRWSDGKKSR